MTKPKQYSNGFDVLYSTEDNPRMGGYSASQWSTLPQGFWARTILWNIRKAEQK